MFGIRMFLIYPAVVFNADVPHSGPRVGGKGNPHVKSKIFLPPARPGETLLACRPVGRAQWGLRALPWHACFTIRIPDRMCENRADRCLTISYVSIFPFSHISVLGILLVLRTYDY